MTRCTCTCAHAHTEEHSELILGEQAETITTSKKADTIADQQAS